MGWIGNQVTEISGLNGSVVGFSDAESVFGQFEEISHCVDFGGKASAQFKLKSGCIHTIE